MRSLLKRVGSTLLARVRFENSVSACEADQVVLQFQLELELLAEESCINSVTTIELGKLGSRIRLTDQSVDTSQLEYNLVDEENCIKGCCKDELYF